MSANTIPQGQELYIKVYEGTGFVDFCGITSTDLTLGPDFIERVLPNYDGDRTVPAPKTNRAGSLNFDFTGSGYLAMDSRTKIVLDAARTGATADFQVIIPDYGTLEGTCLVKVTMTGATNEDATANFEFGWVSEPTFTALV